MVGAPGGCCRTRRCPDLPHPRLAVWIRTRFLLADEAATASSYRHAVTQAAADIAAEIEAEAARTLTRLNSLGR
ncbi:hypothetical protein [Saccharopolyspora sp. ASAGF58]|uniref:hypothetical protein n=1 Tax=Saccharopolyspora sp. ASAGF58 TaxID=2719023 RepID=UPI00144752C1|nr:hypothetical protein [Saccharopolyspora sp. ASAGF58]